jgi:hypothetical protein
MLPCVCPALSLIHTMSSTQPLVGNENSQRVLVLGSGNFGSCLADHLADCGSPVLLWSRSKDVIQSFNEHHRNPKYLTDHVFSENITAIGPEIPGADILRGVGVVLFAIPTQNLRYARPIFPFELSRRLTSPLVEREILGKIHDIFDSQNLPLLIFVNKGIELGSHALTLEIIVDICGPEVAKVSTFLVGSSLIFRRVPALKLTPCTGQSGPSFAKESEGLLRSTEYLIKPGPSSCKAPTYPGFSNLFKHDSRRKGCARIPSTLVSMVGQVRVEAGRKF